MTAADLRDAGMSRAVDHADMRVVALIDAAIEAAIDSGQPWSANDIRAALPTTTSQGLVGARVRSYAARRRPRVMIHTGRYEPSTLPGTHRAEVKVWRGVS